MENYDELVALYSYGTIYLFYFFIFFIPLWKTVFVSAQYLTMNLIVDIVLGVHKSLESDCASSKSYR